MFSACTWISIVAFVAGAIVLPFRFKHLTSRLIESARRRLLYRNRHATFATAEGKVWERLYLARVWGVIASTVFALLVLEAEAPFRDHPVAVVFAIFRAFLAMGVGGLVILGYAMFRSFLPAAQASALLSRFGFRALWVLDPGMPARDLRDGLSGRVRGATRLSIMDVTGQELLGKGPGPSGGLLYDTLATMTSVPVQLLLLQPETQSPDPEQKRATVFQTVLSEMAISPQNYVRRIRATLDAVQTLNESRPQNTKIEVRFYMEKPMIRAILFDDAILVAPFVARESTTPSHFLEVAKEASEPTLYAAFRFYLARLWALSAGKQEAAAKANGFRSVVVRKEAVAQA